MPSPDMTVHTVTLVPGSSEYQNVVSKFQASTGGMHFPKMERVQNPHLYKQYMIRKQKMDKDNGGNNERQLVSADSPVPLNRLKAEWSSQIVV